MLSSLGAASTAIAQQGPPPRFELVPLVSDGSVDDTRTDVLLINPWGIAAGPTGPMWLVNEGTGFAEAFDNEGNQVISVTVPGPETDAPSAPTGVAFNDSTDFLVDFDDGTGPAIFLFATLDGTVAAWNPSSDPDALEVVTVIDNTAHNSEYTGLALMSRSNARSRLYAADFANGRIDVFDGAFDPVALPAGAFRDSDIPSDFAPFNVAVLDGNRVFVAYAQRDADGEEITGHGRGYVDVFNARGELQNRLIQRGHLNAPWGMTIAPSNFGAFSNALLVGSFGSGKIHAYHPDNGEFLGVLRDQNGRRIVLDGLWGLAFGNGDVAGPDNSLFFAAGSDNETAGVYGVIRPLQLALTADGFIPNTSAFKTSVDAEDDEEHDVSSLWPNKNNVDLTDDR